MNKHLVQNILSKIDKSWTLFLDRDGVINKKLENDYVKTIEELELLEGAAKAIAGLSKVFGRIVVVTNQQGIGKKLMSTEDLNSIHELIRQQVENKDGRIDAFYHAPQLASEDSDLRKPKIGMALQAQKTFPEIDFATSIMLGDSVSDMEFAKNAGMIAIGIGMDQSKLDDNYVMDSLVEFYEILTGVK